MMTRSQIAVLALCLASLPVEIGIAWAWKATHQTGPVIKDGPFFWHTIAAGGGSPELGEVALGHQVVAYPQLEGADLGLGWDLLLSRKTNSTCIEFSEKVDNYQRIDSNIQDIVDQETLDVALNSNFTGTARGSIYVFTGNAK